MKFGKLGLLGMGALSLTMALSMNSFADQRDNRPGYDLEFRVRDLERQVSDMNRTLFRLQKRVDELSAGPVILPPPPADSTYACMIVDSGYSKTFLGVAKSKIDAEYNARLSCQSSIHPSYCGNSAQLKCDDNFTPPYTNNFVCMVTDSGYSRTFRGSGRTAIEAEAKAKQSCQESVNASYCGKVAARCEASQ